MDELVLKIIANHKAMAEAIRKDDYHAMSDISVRLASLNTSLAIEMMDLKETYGMVHAEYLLEQQKEFTKAMELGNSPSASKNLSKENTRGNQADMIAAKTAFEKVDILHSTIISQISTVKARLTQEAIAKQPNLKVN